MSIQIRNTFSLPFPEFYTIMLLEKKYKKITKIFNKHFKITPIDLILNGAGYIL